MNFKSLLPAACLAMSATSIASAQTATFTVLDQMFWVGDMTPDGSLVVGTGATGAYYWTLEDGFTFIGGMTATAVSVDGSVIFGQVEDPATGKGVAATWTQADGWVDIGYFFGGACGTNLSSSYDLSADGSVGVGLVWVDGCSGHAFRWTQETGMVPMEHLANGGNRASTVSADGTLAAGFAQGSFSRTPAIWHADGTGELLDPPNGDVTGEVRGMSDDGSILLGNWDQSAFYWTEADGVTTFDTLFATWVGAALDIADDDGTIVGFDFLGLARRAWIKRPGEDADMLTNYLNDLGAEDVPAVLDVAYKISNDGRVIIGHNAFGNGWIVHLSPKCEGDLTGDGSVGADDLAQVLGAWGPCAGCPTDLNGDDVVNAADLAMLLGNWGPCPK